MFGNNSSVLICKFARFHYKINAFWFSNNCHNRQN
jgi:hypothetical protein